MTVFIVAALVRLWALGSIPLIITNDGTGYLANGQQLAYGQPLKIAAVRTPGYPLWLAGIHEVFGTSPAAVLMGNHLLGVLTCVLITAIAARASPWPRYGPIAATGVGLLAAVDPWLLGMESYALTEAISAFMMVLIFGLALIGRRAAWIWGLLLGAAMGYACLVRPTFQLVVPFTALGWLWFVVWGGAGRPRRAGPLIVRAGVLAVCVAVGFAATTVPWLRYNQKRGVEGFARGGDTVFVYGIARAGLLDENYPELTEKHREAYQPLKAAPGNESVLFEFLANADGWHNAESRHALVGWAKYSIKEHFGQYLHEVGYALLWQLNRFPTGGSTVYNELAGYMGRLGMDGTKPPLAFAQPNYQFNDPTYDMTPYAMRAPHGPLARFGTWMEQTFLKHRWTQGLPQIPLFLAAVWTGIVSLRRRRTWPLALVIAGTGAFYAVHVVMLLPFSRYALPVWAAWYIPLALVVPVTVEALRRRPGNAAGTEAGASQ